jgi:hypothetical protein
MTEATEYQGEPATRAYTSKQMGDACEMLVAAELTLAGIPALKVPDNWPGYDIIAQPAGLSQPLRISVKSRTFKKGAAFAGYLETDKFDWLAIVLLECGDTRPRRIFLIPRALADAKARRDSPTAKTATERYWRIDEIAKVFPGFEDNFALIETGNSPAASSL